ncbi:MAG: hypothetical protein IPG93_11065 [Burkholderiales bacterium]|nr:hypothetical protein [Burkholderiales bacterium]
MSIEPRYIALALAAVAYAAGSHLLMTWFGDSPLAMLAQFGPVAVLGIVGLWRSGQRGLALVITAVVVLLIERVFNGAETSPQQVYLLQYSAINIGVGLWFASSMRVGSQPLISRVAERVHGHLDPVMAAYTRRVTLSWVIYFVVAVGVSFVLYLFADFERWSLFANVLTPIGGCSLFVGEYLLRYRLHPEFERVSMAAAVRAWRAPALSSDTDRRA